MSSNTPQPDPAHAPHARALLCLILALGLLGAGASAAQEPRGQSPAPAPTPYVRPRTVGPKAEAAPAPASPAPPAPADGEVGESVDDDDVVRVESNLVLIPASVSDARGRAVTDLRLEDFELKVDGVTKLINDLSRAETPVNIALLFDNSKSLSAAREFEKQAALRFFRAVVRPIDRAAIYSFANAPRLELSFTNNVSRLVQTIENFGAPEGATALFDTLAQAADYISPLAGRKVIVLVSDGSDTLSDLNFEQALNRALRAECQIYVVQTRQIEDPNLHDGFSEQLMLKLTEQTGGAVFVPRSVEDLDAAFTQISLDLSQQYVLSYNPQDERRDKNYFRLIDVSVKARPNLRVRARKGFYPHGEHPGAPPPAERAAQPNGTAPPANARAGANRNARGSKTPARSAARPNAAGRVGPAGPDEDERPAAAQVPAQPAEESKTTLTLTVAESRSAPAPRLTPVPEPTPTPSNPAPQPATTPATAAGEQREEEARRGLVSGGVLNGKALELPQPEYPASARNYGVSGTVIVEVMINEAGQVSEVRIVSGHPMLQQAALRAARRARFSPTTLSGAPVRVKGTINYRFTKP